MNNAERFIDIYNNVDKILKDIDREDYQSFASKIKHSKNPIIRAHKEKLIDYSELRNAITHRPKIGGKFIAEPLTEVVEDFQGILNILRNPKKVFPLFKLDVIGRKADDKLEDILKIMEKESFSQFPIFNHKNKVIELVNTNTISRWLGRNLINNDILVENPIIKDLIEDIEFKENYKFISRDIDVYSAYNIFIEHIEKHKRNLDCLFITNSGNENDSLLGLITIEDIAGQI